MEPPRTARTCMAVAALRPRPPQRQLVHLCGPNFGARARDCGALPPPRAAQQRGGGCQRARERSEAARSRLSSRAGLIVIPLALMAWQGFLPSVSDEAAPLPAAVLPARHHPRVRAGR